MAVFWIRGRIAFDAKLFEISNEDRAAFNTLLSLAKNVNRNPPPQRRSESQGTGSIRGLTPITRYNEIEVDAVDEEGGRRVVSMVDSLRGIGLRGSAVLGVSA